MKNNYITEQNLLKHDDESVSATTSLVTPTAPPPTLGSTTLLSREDSSKYLFGVIKNNIYSTLG